LIPGWATDCRIFALMDAPFNYLMADNCPLSGIEAGFLGSLDEYGLKTVSILGWSMGSFIASDIARKYPEKADEAILVSARERYEKSAINNIKAHVKKNRAGYLFKFYMDFFPAGEADGRAWFRKNLLKTYISEMNTRRLLEGLDYLSTARIEPRGLEGLKLIFINGTEDRIAPHEEAARIVRKLPQASLVSVKGAGHAPFLRPDFTEKLSEARNE
jgi:3-oxoadipate enol-lactonase